MNRACRERKSCSHRNVLPTIHRTCRARAGRKEIRAWIRRDRDRHGIHRKPLRDAEPWRAWFPGPVLPAGMTVEASLVLPIFLFFMAEILYIFDMLRLQSSMLAALHEAGTSVSEYAFYARYGLDHRTEDTEESDSLSGGLESFVLSETYVRSSVASYLGEDWLSSTCLEGGTGGISYLQSSVLAGNDLVDIVADYRIKPFLPLFGLRSFRTQARFYGHAWVGYTPGKGGNRDEKETSDETMVYVTPAGEVYHKDRSCTYLKPSIRTVSAAELDTIRSRDGSKYYPCERCRPEGCSMVVIARDGNRYHASSGCSAIQRDVDALPLSEAEKTRRACSKCGGS